METEELVSVRLAYDQLCVSYRSIDEFRAKLLGFLPLVTGGGLVLVTRNKQEIDTGFFFPVGAFGLMVTFGLLSYEIYGIRKCHALIVAGRRLEQRMGLPYGQFLARPRDALGLINEPFAAAVIYPAVMAAWAFLAAYTRPDERVGLAGSVFLLGLSLMLGYNFWLKWEDRFKTWWKGPGRRWRARADSRTRPDRRVRAPQ